MAGGLVAFGVWTFGAVEEDVTVVLGYVLPGKREVHPNAPCKMPDGKIMVPDSPHLNGYDNQ